MFPALPLPACSEAGGAGGGGKLWDPSSKARWAHDGFEALERGEQPAEEEIRHVGGGGRTPPGGIGVLGGAPVPCTCW